MEESDEQERSLHEEFAKKANGETWALLEKPDRTPEEDERLVLAAHASYYHWAHAGTNVHRQRGEWMLARVYAALGREESAQHHAWRCLGLTERFPDEMQDFDVAYAHESVARAAAAMGDLETAARHRAMAETLGARIADEEDRTIFLGDLRAEPWFGLPVAGG
jgi:hypothetical protein